MKYEITLIEFMLKSLCKSLHELRDGFIPEILFDFLYTFYFFWRNIGQKCSKLPKSEHHFGHVM